MNLRTGDKVIVIAGRDKGKQGTIQKVIPELNRVVVEGVNLRKKHKKPTQANPDGGIVEIYAPIDASNVMLVDPKTKSQPELVTKLLKVKKSATPRRAEPCYKEEMNNGRRRKESCY